MERNGVDVNVNIIIHVVKIFDTLTQQAVALLELYV